MVEAERYREGFWHAGTRDCNSYGPVGERHAVGVRNGWILLANLKAAVQKALGTAIAHSEASWRFLWRAP
jgi:hypothetical protein